MALPMPMPMPVPDPAPLRFEASTPSLGVRLRIVRDKPDQFDMVSLQVASEGGRGGAAVTVLVPVEFDPAGTARPAMDLAALLAPDARLKNHPRDLLWRENDRVLPTPFPLRWYGDQWRLITARSPWVLVLLLYPNPRVARTAAEAAADAGPDGVAALRDFFDRLAPGQQDTARPARLRRGLVHLAPADVPRTFPGEDPAPARRAEAGPVQPDAAFTFALGSCQYPAGLVDGTPQDHGDGEAMPPGPADASMLRLAARLDDPDDTHRPSLLVLSGDQIYADATAGLFDPRAGRMPAPRSSVRDAEHWLRVPYQNWLGSVGTQSVLGRLVTLTMLDDHEIDNNWEPLAAATTRPGADDRLQRLRQAGSLGFQRYQRDLREAQLLAQLWHRHQHRGIGFFMADTRTERGARQAATDPCSPRIIGPTQLAHLLAWIDGDLTWTDDQPAPRLQPDEPALAAARQRPAFIVSPAMLLPRRRSSQRRQGQPGDPQSRRDLRAALHSDAWDGYPGSLHQLLVQLWTIGRSNLVFLSGDEHLSCVVKATVTKLSVPDRAVTLHSVHSSGLYAPYPFANAVPALFALPDDWTFEDPQAPGQRYRCVVEPCGLDAAGSPWAPGDGFALLALTPPANPAAPETTGAAVPAWQLDVRFDRAAPWADRGAQPPAPGVVTAACRLTLAPGPGRYQARPD